MPSTHDDLEMLGLDLPITEAALSQAYRRLVIKHHPDLGGDGQTMAGINRARDRLLASLESTKPQPLNLMARGAAAAVTEAADEPSPFVYLVWMLLLPTVVLTLLFAILSMVT